MLQLQHCTPSLCFSSSRSSFTSPVPLSRMRLSYSLDLGAWCRSRIPPPETRVCHGRLSSRELTRIGPSPCHVSVGVGIGSTGSSLRFVLSTEASCVFPLVNQFVSKTRPVFTFGIHFLRRTYVALLLRCYEQVVGQGVAGIDSWRPPFPHGHHSKAIQRQTAIREGNGRREGPYTP